ncbi:hypothetical protein [Amedibacillus sp. YH-ame10]
MILEIGVDIFDLILGLKSKISDFINWILESSWNNVCAFVKAIGEK